MIMWRAAEENSENLLFMLNLNPVYCCRNRKKIDFLDRFLIFWSKEHLFSPEILEAAAEIQCNIQCNTKK